MFTVCRSWFFNPEDTSWAGAIYRLEGSLMGSEVDDCSWDSWLILMNPHIAQISLFFFFFFFNTILRIPRPIWRTHGIFLWVPQVMKTPFLTQRIIPYLSNFNHWDITFSNNFHFNTQVNICGAYERYFRQDRNYILGFPWCSLWYYEKNYRENQLSIDQNQWINE